MVAQVSSLFAPVDNSFFFSTQFLGTGKMVSIPFFILSSRELKAVCELQVWLYLFFEKQDTSGYLFFF